MRRRILSLLLLLLPYSLYAAEFTLRDIRVQGLQRISAGAVFSELPITVGDRVDEAQSEAWVGALYRTGYFDDVSVLRRREVLLIVVKERPGIAAITLSGNKNVPDEQLIEGLSSAGVSTGQVFDRNLLGRLTKELVSQYQSLGKLGARINTEVRELPDNQVSIEISIDEGDASKIREFNLTGNRKIKDRELLKQMESGAHKWYKFWSSSGDYSRVKLSGDLEALRSAYYDQGYLDFEVRETRVSLSPDKRDIYITVALEEGEQYHIGEVALSCRLAVDHGTLKSRISLRRGDIFSRAETIRSSDAIEQQLKDIGYASAKVNVIPETHEETNTVDVAFLVEPGPKTYIRRINFKGNDDTSEEVFRREMRLFEGAEYSSGKLELSRRRLQRLPYIQSAKVTSHAVAGRQDQIDVDIELVETRSGSVRLGAGFSDAEGAVLSVGVNQDNFLGSGNRVGFNFNNSSSNTNYTFSFLDPFHTINGVSRLWSISYRSIDNSERDINDSQTEDVRLRLNYGIPISESDTLSLGATLQDIKIDPGSNIGTRLSGYYQEQCGYEGDFDVATNMQVIEIRECSFTNLVSSLGLDYDTRDRSLFPTEGSRIAGNLQVFIPIDGLAYYKADYFHRHYFTLSDNDDYIFAMRGRVSYAGEYGDTIGVPPYDRFFAGGSGSLRGYRRNSLGPRDTNDDPLGGDFRTLLGADLFFPTDFLYDRQRLRMSAFVDYGNVFGKAGDFSLDEMRGSYGLQMRWLTAVGGISLSFASHFQDQSGDDAEAFQFDLGTTF